MSDDFNPHADRQFDHCVIPNQPQRPRRYYAQPIIWTILLVLMWSSGAFRDIGRGLMELTARRDDAASENADTVQIRRDLLDELIRRNEWLIDELNKEKGARLQRELSDAHEKARVTGKEQRVPLKNGTYIIAGKVLMTDGAGELVTNGNTVTVTGPIQSTPKPTQKGKRK